MIFGNLASVHNFPYINDMPYQLTETLAWEKIKTFGMVPSKVYHKSIHQLY